MCKLGSRVYWVRVQVWYLLSITLYTFFTVANSSECDVFGTCSQICTDTQNGSYKCSCLEGFLLGHDNRSCTLIDPQLKLIYTEDKGIRCISKLSNGTEQKTDLTNGEWKPEGLTFDARSNDVYWTDVTPRSEAIYRINLSKKSESKPEKVANIGLYQPEGISFDWITSNIYFADKTGGHIGVCRSDSDECVVLVKTKSPCNLALHPNQGLLFWTSQEDGGTIFRAGMDGSLLREILPSAGICQTALVVDQGNSRIFWASKFGELKSSRLDGSDRRVVISHVHIPIDTFGIDVLGVGDRLFWGSREIRGIMSANKYDGSNVLAHDRKTKVLVNDLAFVHAANQPILRSNPCQRAQKCSHICTLRQMPTEFKCFCTAGMILGNDTRTCVELENVNKLVIAFRDTIQSMRFNAIGKNVFEPISVPEIKSISDLVYNPINHTLIISDIATKIIYEYMMNSKQLNVLVSKDLDVVVGLDIDVVGENLYWIDSGKKTIEAMALTTGTRTVIQRGVEHASCLAVVPKMGLLFFGKKDENGEANVYKMFLNGGTITFFQGRKNPISLAYDKETGTILWADKMSGNVESISTDGSSILTLLPSRNVTSDVVKYKDQVFWVDIFEQELQ